jgi:transposase
VTKNRLQSFIHRFNLIPPEGKLFSEENRSWWQQQEFSSMVRLQIEQDLIILEHLSAHKEAIHQELARLSNRQPWASEMVFLMQIPGFGVVLSMTVLAAIGDISRFEHAKKLVGYAGLGAGVHDSGQKHQGKGTLAPALQVQVSPKRAERNSAGRWSKQPGERLVLLPIGKPSTKRSKTEGSTPMKPLWRSHARCWSQFGMCSPNMNLIVTLPMKTWLTRW